MKERAFGGRRTHPTRPIEADEGIGLYMHTVREQSFARGMYVTYQR
jgi:hypothetical protein